MCAYITLSNIHTCAKLGHHSVHSFSEVFVRFETGSLFHMYVVVLIASAQKSFDMPLSSNMKSFIIQSVRHSLSDTELCSDV